MANVAMRVMGYLDWNDQAIGADVSGDFDSLTPGTATIENRREIYHACKILQSGGTYAEAELNDVFPANGWLSFFISFPSVRPSVVFGGAGLGAEIATLDTEQWYHFHADRAAGTLDIINLSDFSKTSYSKTFTNADLSITSHTTYIAGLDYSGATNAMLDRSWFLESNPAHAFIDWVQTNWSNVADYDELDYRQASLDYRGGVTLEDATIIVDDGTLLVKKNAHDGSKAAVDATVNVAVTAPAFQVQDSGKLKHLLYRALLALNRMCTQYNSSVNSYWGQIYISSPWHLKYNVYERRHEYRARFTLKRSTEEST